MTKKNDKEYVPPKVWKWKVRKDDPFAGMNRPIAGATHEKELPRGQHPFQQKSRPARGAHERRRHLHPGFR
jgi:hypothetical protein